MRESIINNLDKPVELEKLYRDNKTTFKKAFNLIYPDIQGNTIAQAWHERLNFEKEEITWGTSKDLLFVIIASFIAGLDAKIPDLIGISQDYFFPRNIGFVVFPFLTAFFAWKHKIPTKRLILVAVAFIISAIYINILPDDSKSDTLILACIHLPLFLWAVLGFTFAGDHLYNYQRRVDFLRYNGDLVVMTTILVIAGALLTSISFGLFKLIDIKIEEFFNKYIVVWGGAAAPILGTYLVRTNPQLVNKVSPIVARVFTPLVLVTLVIYLIAVIYSGKSPYNDREFLMVFNLLLIGVMAIIFFSIAETARNSDSGIGRILLLALSIITIIVNGIALSAILFRIAEYGITPNRLAVLGSNMLILTNLFLVAFRLLKAINNNEIEKVEKSIASFLPIYMAWTIVVTFLFPVLFGFK